ncbi:MAG: hypothetical protein AAF564_16190 [Bacteroidota bacterium]
MTSIPVRYRYAALLLWAACALVLNPVFDAFSHSHDDCHNEGSDVVALVEGTAEDLCPYCDAVSPFADTATPPPFFLLEDLDEQTAVVIARIADCRLFLSARLRAPPAMA